MGINMQLATGVRLSGLFLLLAAICFGQTAEQRLNWVVMGTVGPTSTLSGIFNSGIATWSNTPKEYGPHWGGFAKREGMRTAGVATSKAMEASLGALWGEDPRYLRAATGKSIGGRLGHAAKLTFLASDREGNTRPAYARYLAIPGSNALSNTWRPDSEADAKHVLTRTAFGFMGKFIGNSFQEFWPDAKRKLFHHNP
jgi:hypothetical protein